MTKDRHVKNVPIIRLHQSVGT